MTDIEKQRGKEYTKEELFESLSAAKLEAEELRKRVLVNNAVTDRQREIIEGHDKDIRVFVDAVKSAESSRDRYKTGHDRYEKIRLLSSARFKALCDRNLMGENFDAMVDALGKPGEG